MTTSSSAPPTSETLQRVLAFIRDDLIRTADVARPVDGGVVLTTPSLPLVWSVNQLRVSAPSGFDAVIALAARELRGFDYRHVVVEDQVTGPALAARFRGAGWGATRDLQMILAGDPDRPAATAVVSEADEDEVLELMARWHGEGASVPADEIAQLTAFSRRQGQIHGDRLLGARSGDGALVAITKLRGDGRTARIEDVYTVPEARGRGYARALVSCAAELARAAGHDLVFITADENDWPKRLYARLGFRALARVWQFHTG